MMTAEFIDLAIFLKIQILNQIKIHLLDPSKKRRVIFPYMQDLHNIHKSDCYFPIRTVLNGDLKQMSRAMNVINA